MNIHRKFNKGILIEEIKGGERHAQKTQAIPRDQWPAWAKVLSSKAIPQDKGIGDVCYRLIGAETSEKFKAFYLVTFGKPCGCTGRQARWNIQYPLNAK